MTDPISLAPILLPEDRPTPLFADPDLTHEERYDLFVEHVHGGKKVEARDWMPDEYRQSVLRFVEMHANSELMGVLPEREWIMRAPTLKRKLALTAKVQDECGHAQLLYRVAEDLGKPREQMYQDLLDGKTKFHNVFHYPTKSWGDVGIIAWLVDAAAIVAQQALRDSSYGPYSRTMKKSCWEESVHIMHGRDVVVTMMNGSQMQRGMVQEALDRWWGPLMQMHGPRTDPAKDRFPSYLAEHMDGTEAVIREDPRWQDAMRKRGITDFSLAMIDAWPSGYYGAQDHFSNSPLICRPLTFMRTAPSEHGDRKSVV